MLAYILGVLVSEGLCLLLTDPGTWEDMLGARAGVYVVALAIWTPIGASLALARRSAAPAAPEPSPRGGTYAVKLPENVTVHYRLAPLSSRLGAILVDLGILGVVFSSFHVVFLSGTHGEGVTIFFQSLILLASFSYFAWYELHRDGQTPGKKAVGLRAIHTTGRRLYLTECLARTLLRPLSVIPLLVPLELFCLRTGPHRQRLGDLAASSVVVVDPV